MPAFAVLEPPGHHRGASEYGDRFIFLRERFRWGAFLFGPLWMIRHRLLVVLIIYVAVIGLLGYGLLAAGVGWFASAFILGLIQFLIGLEATTVLRWTRIRHGWRDCGVVVADDLELAERRFFDSRVALRPAAGPLPTSVPQPLSVAHVGPSGPDVIGLFPEPGGGR